MYTHDGETHLHVPRAVWCCWFAYVYTGVYLEGRVGETANGTDHDVLLNKGDEEGFLSLVWYFLLDF